MKLKLIYYCLTCFASGILLAAGISGYTSPGSKPTGILCIVVGAVLAILGSIFLFKLLGRKEK